MIHNQNKRGGNLQDTPDPFEGRGWVASDLPTKTSTVARSPHSKRSLGILRWISRRCSPIHPCLSANLGGGVIPSILHWWFLK